MAHKGGDRDFWVAMGAGVVIFLIIALIMTCAGDKVIVCNGKVSLVSQGEMCPGK